MVKLKRVSRVENAVSMVYAVKEPTRAPEPGFEEASRPAERGWARMSRAPRKGEGYGGSRKKKGELQRLWGGGLELRG